MEATGNNTLHRLKEIIIEVTQAKISPAQIGDHAYLFEDCGIDSTSVVDLVLLLEERFDIAIAEDELESGLLQDLSSLARLVDAKCMALQEGPATA
jgi:acyl carrier protein